jgi:hypothetical protein
LRVCSAALPAAKIGLGPGDTITSLNGRTIGSALGAQHRRQGRSPSGRHGRRRLGRHGGPVAHGKRPADERAGRLVTRPRLFAARGRRARARARRGRTDTTSSRRRL